jgi:hypothetical protein
MERRYTASTSLALALFTAVFAVQVYRAATLPIHAREAYVYDRFVRPTTRQVFASELPNRDVLYSVLERRSVGLFHVSPFTVRLPSLLFALLYLRSIWRLGRRLLGTGWFFLPAVALAGLPLTCWGCFSAANGVGAALALQMCAVQLALSVKPENLNLSGVCLGLSVGARLEFAIPAAVLALGILGIHRRWAAWTDRVLITALVAALALLVLPLSHAHAVSETPADLTVPEAALRMLRASVGNSRVQIGASAGIEPIVNFYRAQHRIATWEQAGRNLVSGNFDYYLLTKSDAGLIEQRHLIVLYRDAGFVLARRSYDAL